MGWFMMTDHHPMTKVVPGPRIAPASASRGGGWWGAFVQSVKCPKSLTLWLQLTLPPSCTGMASYRHRHLVLKATPSLSER